MMRIDALHLASAAAILIASNVSTQSQEPAETTRQIVAEEFLKKRPAAVKPAPPRKASYRLVTPKTSSKSGDEAVDLGVTLWRLRPAQSGEDGARLLVQEAADLTAERLDAGAPLAIGERVRLTIESPMPGYLYVIDRELFADGSMSEPYLIFPTSRTRQGDNAVKPGRLVDIPDQADRPNYFTVRPSRPDQTGELISIVVTPTPLDEVTIDSKAVVLSKELVSKWESAWAAPFQQFALEGGAKKLWTKEEKAAASESTRLLKQDDPPPQTLFRLNARRGAPILVSVRLPYSVPK
jgi:hypothetical protein